MPQRFGFTTPQAAPIDPLVAALLRGGQGPSRTNLEGLGKLAQTLSGALRERQLDVQGRQEQAEALSALLSRGGETILPPEENIAAGPGSDIAAGFGVPTVESGPLQGPGFDVARDVISDQPRDLSQGVLGRIFGLGNAPSKAQLSLAEALINRGFANQDAQAQFGRRKELFNARAEREDQRFQQTQENTDRRARENRQFQSTQLEKRLAAEDDKFRTDQGKAIDDVARAERLFGQDSPQAAAMRDAAKTPGGKPKLSDVRGLRQEHTKLSGDFIKVRDSFAKIETLAAAPSAAGDLGLIFNIMKMFDPGSTVREGEFATAQNAAGVPGRIQSMYNRVISGERLTEPQRADFLNTAQNVFSAQSAAQKRLDGAFRSIAERQGMEPANVVIDFSAGLPPTPSDAPPPAPTAADPQDLGPVNQSLKALEEQLRNRQPQ